MRQDPRAAEAMAFLSKPAAEQAALRAAATADKALATTDKAASPTVPQEADDKASKAAAVAAASHQPVAQSTAKHTAAHAAPKAIEQPAKAAAQNATADQANKAAGKKPTVGKSAQKAAARKPASVRHSTVSLVAPSESAEAAQEAAARTAQAKASAAAVDLLSQAASVTGTPQRAASVSSEGKVPTANPAAAASSSQAVVKAVAPLLKPAPVSEAAKHTVGTGHAAQRGSGEVITQHAPAAQAPAQQVRSKPATAHTALKRPAPAQALRLLPSKQLQRRWHP